jgi:hypothetical protein
MPATDGIMGALAEAADSVGSVGSTNDVRTSAADRDPLNRFVARFAAQLRALRDECATLSPADLTMDASPEAYALAARYTVVLAAACALAVWREGGQRYSAAGLLGVLDRLSARLDGVSVLTTAERESVEARLFDEAVARFHDRRLFGLAARRVPG